MTTREEYNYLKRQFPWLGTDDDVSGADVVDHLNEVFEDLCNSLGIDPRDDDEDDEDGGDEEDDEDD